MIRLKIQMGMELLSFLNDPPKMVHRSTYPEVTVEKMSTYRKKQ